MKFHSSVLIVLYALPAFSNICLTCKYVNQIILAPDGQAFIGRTLPTSPVKVGKGNHGKLAAFTQLYINFEHEKRWVAGLVFAAFGDNG